MTKELRLVSDDEIVAYQGLIDKLARRLDGREGAEYDDLAQMGRISVWRALERGRIPSEEVILNRMRDWVRLVTRQRRGEVADESLLDL